MTQDNSLLRKFARMSPDSGPDGFGTSAPIEPPVVPAFDDPSLKLALRAAVETIFQQSATVKQAMLGLKSLLGVATLMPGVAESAAPSMFSGCRTGRGVAVESKAAAGPQPATGMAAQCRGAAPLPPAAVAVRRVAETRIYRLAEAQIDPTPPAISIADACRERGGHVSIPLRGRLTGNSIV